MKITVFVKVVLIVTLALSLSACMTPQARYNKDYALAKKNFAEQNYHSAFQQIQEPAKAGNADAQYALGYMYYNGLGTIADHRKAAFWFTKAASQGQADAKRALRQMQTAEINHS